MTQAVYILDTNIWLDWLVFQNDSLDEMKAVHARGGFNIIYTAEMLAEFIDVIGRARFKLTEPQKSAILTQWRQIAYEVETLPKPLNAIHCKDKDDQVFIDMALAHHASWLITKDKHLLALRSRAAKHAVRVGTVMHWQRDLKAL